MNMLLEMSDDEFIPFLKSLGVDTYKKSFEWMLNDLDFAGVLRWLYQNLNHSNALSPREEYRYAELIKHNELLCIEDLESAVAALQDEFKGLCLPGDKETVEDVSSDISRQKERLLLLEKQEKVLQDLLKQNESTKEELNQEITKFHTAESHCLEDESSAADECLQLADEVEDITDEVIAVVADTLDIYSNCNTDKDLARKFFTFGPFEPYRQTQALFRSHFDLYTCKKFSARLKQNVTDDDLRAALVEAKNMEERLTDAALAYIETKAELAGEQAKLNLVANYSNVHPSQISSCFAEAQSSLELSEQEEYVLDQQLQSSVKEFVSSRTRLAIETTARSALAVRELLHTDLTCLLDNTQQALALDRLLYCALRNELRNLEELVQFASHLKQYVNVESEAVVSRINSMNEICKEHEMCEQKLQSSDCLLKLLCRILGVLCVDDVTVLVKANSELMNSVADLEESVMDCFQRKEQGLSQLIKNSEPLRNYVFDGCTKQPNCWDRTVASLTHSLKQEMEKTDKKVLEASSLFTSVKNGDKNHLRKLWQWFMTDPAKLSTAMKGVYGKNYM